MDEMKEIEERKSGRDIGVMVARVYEGALEETGERRKAFWITVAYCVGMMKSGQKDDESDE